MSAGKLFILAGVLLVGAGVVMLAFPKIPWLGKLPGDILIKKGDFTFYFPLATCLLASLLITLALKLFLRR